MRTILFTLILCIFSYTQVYAQSGIDYGAVYDAAYSHDGTKIATATDRGLQIWNAEPFELIDEYVQENGFLVLKWSSDDTFIFASQLHITFERLFIVYNTNTQSPLVFPNKVLKWMFYDNGSQVIRPLVHKNTVNFSQNSSFLATVNNNNAIEIYSLENREIIFHKEYDEPDIPYSIHYTNDENVIAIGLSGNRIQFIELNTEKVVNDLQLELEPEIGGGDSLFARTFYPFYFSTDQNYFFSLNDNVNRRLETTSVYYTSYYEIKTGKYLSTINNSQHFTWRFDDFGNPSRFYYMPDSETMYLFNEEPIRLHDLKTGEESEIEGFNPGEFTTYFTQPFSPDGTKVLSDDYKAIITIPLGPVFTDIRNPEPKGPDLFLNDLLTGEKTRLLPLPSTIENYQQYE